MKRNSKRKLHIRKEKYGHTNNVTERANKETTLIR